MGEIDSTRVDISELHASMIHPELERKEFSQMKNLVFPLLLCVALPLTAQHSAPTPISTTLVNRAIKVEPPISSLRAQIAAGRRELKATVAFEKAALKLSEAQIRLEIVRRQDASRLAAATAAK
jgi:hypothetical protein